MKDTHVNEGVEVVILPSATRAVYGSRDAGKMQKAVMTRLLLRSKETYHKVYVHAKHAPDGCPVALHAYMLRAYTYTTDLVKLVVDAKYNVQSVDTSYGGDEEGDYGESVAQVATVPGVTVAGTAVSPGTVIGTIVPRRVDMVFGTPVPEIPSAKKAVEDAYKTATAAGYRAVKLLGPAANLANYKKYLSGHLKAFGNVGHGYTGGIVLSDGNLTSTWFSGLPKKSLSPEVIYYNSCQVFNPPLQPAIMNAGARTFVGGKVNLLIGKSELVFNCFWAKVLGGRPVQMGLALTTCEKANYPTPGAHGISGDLGRF